MAAGGKTARASQSRTGKPPRIQRVPQTLVRDDKDYKRHYVPRVVSIGPFHHRDESLQHFNDLKLQKACQFVSQDKEKLEVLFNKLLDRVRELRDCYEENSTNHFPDEEFIRIMLIDGCFVLNFIQHNVVKNARDLELKNHMLPLIRIDLFLLENQLPFVVLDVLITNISTLSRYEWFEIIGQFTRDVVGIRNPRREVSFKYSEGEVPAADLLHLMHQIVVGSKDLPSECEGSSSHSFDVHELMALGIRVRRSNSDCLTDISYRSTGIFAQLRIPPVSLDNATGVKFMNLIAYEMCPDFSDLTLWFTSYVCFLGFLINSADDVRELRSAGVVSCFLRNDQEVADMFNDMSNVLLPDPSAYYSVRRLIQDRYTNKRMIYLARLGDQISKNRWTFYSLIAAILALCLSFFQIYFQIQSPPSPCEDLCKYIKGAHHL